MQLAEGLTGRVEPDKLVLYGPEPYEDGATVRFALTLIDGSAALEGIGRAIQSIDGGDERPEVARFDILLDSLEFSGSAQVIYDRILMVQQQAFDGPATGEVSADELEAEAHDLEDVTSIPSEGPGGDGGHDDPYADASAYGQDAAFDDDPYAMAPGVPTDSVSSFDGVADESTTVGGAAYDPAEYTADDPASGTSSADPYGTSDPYAGSDPYAASDPYAGDPYASSDPYGGAHDPGAFAVHEATGEVDIEDVQPVFSTAPPQPPPRPGGFVVPTQPMHGGVLSRPSRGASWEPRPSQSPEPRPETGYFNHIGGLPIPDGPPRPDLDPSMRVTAAPRPQAGANGALGGGSVRPSASTYDSQPVYEAADADLVEHDSFAPVELGDDAGEDPYDHVDDGSDAYEAEGEKY
jgi:hypothetical protein